MSSPELEGILSPREQLEATINTLLHLAEVNDRHSYTRTMIKGSIVFETILLSDEVSRTILTRESELQAYEAPIRVVDDEDLGDQDIEQAVFSTESYIVMAQDTSLEAITFAGLAWRPYDKILPPRIFDIDGDIILAEDDMIIREMPSWLAHKADLPNYMVKDVPAPPDPFRHLYAQQVAMYCGRILTEQEIANLLGLGAKAAYKESLDEISEQLIKSALDPDTP